MILSISRGIDREECISPTVAFKYNKLCVSSALLDDDLNVFILKFVQTSLQEDYYYRAVTQDLSAKFWINIRTRTGDKHCQTFPDCAGYYAPRLRLQV